MDVSSSNENGEPRAPGGAGQQAGDDEALWTSVGLVLEEIRVLTGLSRGAAIPIESMLRVGSDPECDLVLHDPLVAPCEAQLERPEGAGGPLKVDWLEQPADETGIAAVGPITRSASIALGDVFLVSGVSLQYCNSDAPWDYSLLPKTIVPALPPTEVAVARGPWHRRPRALGVIAAACILAGVLAVAGIYYFHERERELAEAIARRTSAAQARAPTLEQVARKLQEEIDGRGMSTVKIAAGRDHVKISGNVPGERQEEFEGVVERARALHRRVRFRIDNAVDSPVGPIVDIVAIVGGAAPNALLGDGQQLYIGADIQGFRLVGIEGACAVFRVIDSSTRISRCLGTEKKP
jgi:hypothetical protein